MVLGTLFSCLFFWRSLFPRMGLIITCFRPGDNTHPPITYAYILSCSQVCILDHGRSQQAKGWLFFFFIPSPKKSPPPLKGVAPHYNDFNTTIKSHPHISHTFPPANAVKLLTLSSFLFFSSPFLTPKQLPTPPKPPHAYHTTHCLHRR